MEQTKLRVLREAVNDNLVKGASMRPRRRGRSKRSRYLWLSSSLLLVVFLYIELPTIGIFKGNVSALDPSQQPPQPSSSPADSAIEEAEVAVSTPRPLSRAVLPLSIKTVVIDAGHGGKQTGAISDSGLLEKEITLDVALRLHRLLEKAPFEVFLTRETDQTIPLQKRVAFANSKNADLFVSIHVNWMEPREIRALETYFVGPSDDPATLKLASIENRDSGYSFSDYRRILEKIYVDARRDESRRLASSIQTELYHSLRQANPDLENRGVKMAPFVVLIGTQMPAILVEISCLSNDSDVKLLQDAEYREKIALALLKGIRSYANNLNATERKGS